MHYTDPVTLDDLETIAAVDTSPTVSLYLPTSRHSKETDKDIIILKNLRREAAMKLSSSGLPDDEIDTLLAPVDDLLDEREFWSRLSDGLAIFLSPALTEIYRVPLRLDERVSVGPRFILKPLLPLLNGGATFHILALSQNEVRLFEGTRFQVSQVPSDELPANMNDALVQRGREEGRLPNRQWQGDEGTKILYRKYFRHIDRVLRPLLREDRSPLVLAGVDYLLPIYREITSYRYLADGEITGNPETFRGDELHAKALPIVEPILDAPRAAAISQFQQGLQNGAASADPEAILQAAAQGRVATLLIDPARDLLGTVSPDGTGVTINPGESGDAYDLSGQAARWTFGAGGTVYHCEAEDLPDTATMGAVFRY